jgi:hypothetical protein
MSHLFVALALLLWVLLLMSGAVVLARALVWGGKRVVELLTKGGR